nr:GNAT family N-acetyltransferase [Thetidibacter halocola]
MSRELGDPHRTVASDLGRALFGASGFARACVAEGSGGLSGIILFTPLFSTVRGGAGLYVSDVWVGEGQRGRGLGLALLRSAAEIAGQDWDARFMRLSVHDDNHAARAFYGRLGFEPAAGETLMVLTDEGFQRLRRMT